MLVAGDSAAGGPGRSSKGSRADHGQDVAQPWGEELRPLRVRPRRRAARRAGDARQDAARHPARPPDQGRLHRRDRGLQARGLPEPELHRRLRPVLCRYLGMEPDKVFHRFCQESGFVGNAGGQAMAQGGRRGARRSRCPAASGPTPDRVAGRPRRPARGPALGDRLGAGARRPARRARLRRLDGAAEHPARAVRPGRGAAGRGGRGRAAGGARERRRWRSRR